MYIINKRSVVVNVPNSFEYKENEVQKNTSSMASKEMHVVYSVPPE